MGGTDEAAVLRDFREEDLDEVRRLVVLTIDAKYPAVYPPRAVDYFKQFHSEDRIMNDAEQGLTVVLELDGRIVATGTVVGNNIRRVFVLPEYQGRGLGKQVMTRLERHALAEGVESVELDVSLVSKRFYDRLGYRLAKRDYVPLEDGQRLDYYLMTKYLASEQDRA